MQTLPSIVTGTADQEKPMRGLGASRPMLRVAPGVASVAPPVLRMSLSQASTPSLRGWPLARSATVPVNGPLTVCVLPEGSTTRIWAPAGIVMESRSASWLPTLMAGTVEFDHMQVGAGGRQPRRGVRRARSEEEKTSLRFIW